MTNYTCGIGVALDVAALKRGLTTAAVGPDNPYDLNRDGRVNALDLAAVKASLTRTLALPPVPPPARTTGAPPASVTDDVLATRSS